MAVGIRLVKAATAAAFVSAGNTGAVMAMATLTLGRHAAASTARRSARSFPASRALPAARCGRECGRPPGLSGAVRAARQGLRRAGAAHRRAAGRTAQHRGRGGKGSEFAREATPLEATSRHQFRRQHRRKGFDRVTSPMWWSRTASPATWRSRPPKGVAEFILRRDARQHSRRGCNTSSRRMVLRPALLAACASRIDYAEYGGAPLAGIERPGAHQPRAQRRARDHGRGAGRRARPLTPTWPAAWLASLSALVARGRQRRGVVARNQTHRAVGSAATAPGRPCAPPSTQPLHMHVEQRQRRLIQPGAHRR